MSAEDAQNEKIALFEYWNDLPNELKMECIKKMTFITRTKLKLASKTEKTLVESKGNYPFYHVHIKAHYNDSAARRMFNNTLHIRPSLEFVAKSDAFGTELVANGINAPSKKKLFRTLKIERFNINVTGNNPRAIKFLDELIRARGKIHAETVQITLCIDNDLALKLLKKFDPACLKKIIVGDYSLRRTYDLFKMPQISAVQTVRFQTARIFNSSEIGRISVQSRCLCDLIQEIIVSWKINGYPLDKEALLEEHHSSAFSYIRDIFASVVIPENGKSFRIPTEDAKKCIWFFKPNRLNYFVMFIAEKPSANVPIPDFEAIEKRKIEEENTERKKLIRWLQDN